MRVSTRLPCQWQLFTSQPARQELLSAFGLPAQTYRQAEWDDLSAQIAQALAAVPDRDTRRVLTLLNSKIDQLAGPAAQVLTPPLKAVVLSLQGMDLPSERSAEPGTWAGVHLLLDNGFSFVEPARITRCVPTQTGDADAGFVAPGYLIGVSFESMAQSNARRLARHVLKSREQAA